MMVDLIRAVAFHKRAETEKSQPQFGSLTYTFICLGCCVYLKQCLLPPLCWLRNELKKIARRRRICVWLAGRKHGNSSTMVDPISHVLVREMLGDGS